jgi:hypothetical protein
MLRCTTIKKVLSIKGEMPRDLVDSFVETYVEALHDQNAAVFAGAGLSISAGMVNWKELLRDIYARRGIITT